MKTHLLKQALTFAVLFVFSATSSNFSNLPAGGSARASYGINHPGIRPEKKTFTFNELRAGDCVIQAGGTLDVYPDGHAEFHATVWTNHTHSGDTWHHHIYFNDAAGVVIFQVSFDGPGHMNDDGTHYAFNSTFNFPAQIYNAIYTVSASGNC